MICVLLLVLGAMADARPALFYDRAVPQAAFAASEVVKASGAALPEFGLDDVGKVQCTPCVVIASGERAAALARSWKVDGVKSGKPQAYAIRRSGSFVAALGADADGAMYGGLDLAEKLRLGTLEKAANSDHAPHIERRGIKFNIPLDSRTPTYSDNSDAAQANIPEMWSFDFWREFLDEMARHRYNVLSLWSLHPFPSMVKVPEFPDVALADVKRTRYRMDETYTHTGSDMVRPELLEHLETLRTMTIEDKIRFWRDVMEYAARRGIKVWVITWNIFTYGAEGKYGITSDQTNAKTIEYFRASVREMVTTYPLLAGMGITAGEQMREIPGEFSKEKWLWKTYGEGIRDALKQQPGRQFGLIHRYHQTGQEEILHEFRDYPGTFELSFKYSVAHMYSIPNPPYIQDVLKGMPAGRKTWLTVRNDDVYSFRWGDPRFARAYIKAIPGADRIAGFYMGPDGYIWGREFLSRKPQKPRELVMRKQWYSFLLWGRLAYEPDLPDAHFESIVTRHFPEVNGAALYQAWAEASQVFPLITRFFWGDIDLRWFPEACLSHPRHRGFYTVRHFVEGQSMPGSGVLNILEWRKRKLAGQAMGGVTPLEIAAGLESAAGKALDGIGAMRGGSQELRETLGDIRAMSYLAQYYAAKIRGAAALALYDRSSNVAEKKEAVEALTKAAAAWQNYARTYSEQYTTPHLYNRVGFVDMNGLTIKAKQDVDIAEKWKPGTIAGDEGVSNAGDRLFRK
ncbi:MAG: carbohydrate-binding family 6 protein [Acidobacteria bacterium]|nr:carbohydrate-binding family 6 protein [Acidobacteriota bacterium]